MKSFRGKFAKVYKCQDDKDKKVYAMKVMNKQDISMMLKSKKKAYEMLNEELVILKKMVSSSS